MECVSKVSYYLLPYDNLRKPRVTIVVTCSRIVPFINTLKSRKILSLYLRKEVYLEFSEIFYY